MFKKLFLLILVAAAGVLIYSATKPDEFRVERSITIMTPPEKVYAIITDFNKWSTWSPWEGKDPAMKKTISGAPNGKGAVYEWEGNKEVGKGRMEIIEATPPSKVVMKLDFFSPFEAHNTAEYTLNVVNGATDVKWAMHGPSPYMMKVITTFCSMDKMVGKDFEKGLSNLKAQAEK